MKTTSKIRRLERRKGRPKKQNIVATIPQTMRPQNTSLLTLLRAVLSKPSRAEQLSKVAANHEAFKIAIWEFRKAHGWAGERIDTAPPGYFKFVRAAYRNLKLTPEVKRIIALMAREPIINSIRQRHRMRRKPPKLSPKEVGRLTDEIAAVLRWNLGTS